jgi:hypothetical protein
LEITDSRAKAKVTKILDSSTGVPREENSGGNSLLGAKVHGEVTLDRKWLRAKGQGAKVNDGRPVTTTISLLKAEGEGSEWMQKNLESAKAIAGLAQRAITRQEIFLARTVVFN